MPTNLPPECLEIEERYRAAESIGEKIACLEELLAAIPKHKGTDRLRADYRRKLSQLKADSKAKKGVARRDSPFRIEREGAGQIAVIGPPNVGKSALVAALTNAAAEVSASPFTTRIPIPGMMPIDDIQVQLVDTPPLCRDYAEPELPDLIRRSDLILLVVDLQTEPVEQLNATVALLEEHGLVPRRGGGGKSEAQGIVSKPILVLANKADAEDSDELFEVFRLLLEEEWPMLSVSAMTGRNLEKLKRVVFEMLGIIRVYSKPPGKRPDLSAPFILKKGSTVEELASRVHRDFLDKLTAAKVWGSAQFPGQMVARDYVLQDGDTVELRI
jgi:hypothetical protein